MKRHFCSTLKRRSAAGLMLAMGLFAGTSNPALAAGDDDKLIVYYSMSYVGNAWQTIAQNLISAMAKTEAFKDRVELRVQASGPNAQRQIQQINGMIAAGADAILLFPISETALNPAIKAACDRGIVVVAINGVTEPCAYVAKLDGVEFGERRANYVIDQMGGEGNLVYVTGVPGVSYSEEHDEGVRNAVAANPGVNLVAELVGMWDQSTARVAMREFLATSSWDQIDGIVTQTGCYTISLMQVEDGYYPDNPIIPCSGESANASRLQMLPVDSGVEGALGRDGLSVGAGLWAMPYLLKIAVDVIDGKEHEKVFFYNDYVVEVTPENVKLCETGAASEFAAGCNTIPPGIVPEVYNIDIWSPLVPEMGFNAALIGEPD